MKKIILPFVMVTLLAVACKTANDSSASKPKEKEKKAEVLNKPILMPSGLSYTILTPGAGEKIQTGDVVTVHYVGKLQDGTVFDESRTANRPFTFKVGSGQVIRGWEEGFTYLRKGEKALLQIPPSLGYGDQPAGKIPANATINFEVEVLNVAEGRRPFDVSGKDTVTTPSGLKYILVKKSPANTTLPTTGDKLKVHYSGYLTDGKIFDSSVDRGEPIAFLLGKGHVIKGWDEAMALLRTGEKARLIIPSQLAYGENGAGGVIPPGATLVFDVELMEIIPKVVPVPFNTTGIQEQTTANGIKYYVITKGTGVKAVSGKTVKVHYTGYFQDGKIFDSSVERGEPFTLKLGAGMVIQGWEEMLQQMSAGDKVRAIIPHTLAYGENGYPPVIPPKTNLIFDMELIDVMETPTTGHEGHDHSDPNHKH